VDGWKLWRAGTAWVKRRGRCSWTSETAGEMFLGEVAFGGVGDWVPPRDAFAWAGRWAMAQAQWIMAPELEPARRAFFGGEAFDAAKASVSGTADFVADGAVEGVGDERRRRCLRLCRGRSLLQDEPWVSTATVEDARVLLLRKRRVLPEKRCRPVADAGDEGVNAGDPSAPEFAAVVSWWNWGLAGLSN